MNKKRLRINLITFFSMIFVSVILIVVIMLYSTLPGDDFPAPVQCHDPNAVTFDDDNFSFAKIDDSEKDSANGELTVVEIKGNKLLRFNNDGTNFSDNKVQKIKLDVAKLLSPENLAKVRSIEMDVYADATANKLITDNGENVKAPGWIGGGAGANVANDKWYKFGDWESGEYDFSMSENIHLELKFLLAVKGQHWTEDMDEATLMIMRWGLQNESNFYIDNIIFYDENKNSLPIEKQ